VAGPGANRQDALVPNPETPEAKRPGPRTIVVFGEGVARAVPDRCVIHVALNVTKNTVADAIAGVSALADDAVAALRATGIGDSDVATQGLAVHDWIDQQEQRVTARVATYTFTVTARELGDVSPLVNVLTATAGDSLQIRGISFSHSEYKSLQAQARRDAVADARARAELLADAAGVQLGEITTIEDASGGGGWVARAVSGGPQELSAPVMPMSPGGQSVGARVAVTYAIS
jgi:uncharacterized protein